MKFRGGGTRSQTSLARTENAAPDHLAQIVASSALGDAIGDSVSSIIIRAPALPMPDIGQQFTLRHSMDDQFIGHRYAGWYITTCNSRSKCLKNYFAGLVSRRFNGARERNVPAAKAASIALV